MKQNNLMAKNGGSWHWVIDIFVENLLNKRKSIGSWKGRTASYLCTDSYDGRSMSGSEDNAEEDGEEIIRKYLLIVKCGSTAPHGL